MGAELYLVGAQSPKLAWKQDVRWVDGFLIHNSRSGKYLPMMTVVDVFE
jgi:hypothetical protein